MSTLKVKLKLQGLEFELEGDEATVKEEFTNFKLFIVGDLLSKLNVITPQTTTTTEKEINQIERHENINECEIVEPPLLKDIVKKDLPKTETDWILVYAFYASSFGENTFTEQDIKKFYESTGRKSSSRTSNLSNNVKSLFKQDYIKSHNDSEYRITANGIASIKKILSGNSSSSTVKRPLTKSNVTTTKVNTTKGVKKQKTTKTNSIDFVDLNLPSTDIISLTEFFNNKNPKGQNEEVAVVMSWYQDYAKTNGISPQEIKYLLRICTKEPAALEQVLINMKGSKFHWITNESDGKVSLTSLGKSHVINKLPKVNK